MAEATQRSRDDEGATITVYWRPGCPFCSRLLRWIDRAGITTTRRHIWDDPDAAAELRAITGGDETVPTVLVGEIPLVNPSPRRLEAAIATHAPGLLPAPAAHDKDGNDGNDGNAAASSAPPRGSRWWDRTRRRG